VGFFRRGLGGVGRRRSPTEPRINIHPVPTTVGGPDSGAVRLIVGNRSGHDNLSGDDERCGDRGSREQELVSAERTGRAQQKVGE